MRELYDHFVPHLQRAVRVQQRLTRAEGRAGTLRAVLDRLDVAVLLVDGSGRIVYANSSAESALSTADALGVRNGRPVCARSNDTAALRALLTGASNRGSNGLPPGGALRVSRLSGRQALQLEVTPLGGASSLDDLP